MKRSDTKKIAVALLFFLAWSCFGLNMGMLSHDMMISDSRGEDVHAAHAHDCCGVEAASGVSADTAEAASMEHHTLSATLVSRLDMSVPIFLVALFFFAAFLFIPTGFVEKGRLYFRRWRDELSHRALSFLHLFSNGILHSKAW